MAQISVLESLAREKWNISLNTDKTFPNEHGLQSAHNNSDNQIKKKKRKIYIREGFALPHYKAEIRNSNPSLVFWNVVENSQEELRKREYIT